MRIAVLGTGVMGSGLAEGLMKAGHDVIVYNRTIEKTARLVTQGAKAFERAADAIEAADATIIVLSDGESVRNVLLNNDTRTILKGKKILNASTTSYEEIIALSKETAPYGCDLGEVSLLVGAEELRNRQGQFIFASNPEVKDFWSDILKSIGTAADYVGTVGDASKAEATMLFGSMFLSMTAAYSGAMALKLNIPQEVVAKQLSMVAPGTEYLLPNIFARNYDQCMASTNSFRKVSDTAISTVKSLGFPTKVLEDILAIYEMASARGYGEKDGSSIVEVLLDPKV